MRVQALLPKTLKQARLKDRVLGDVCVPGSMPVGVDHGSIGREAIASDRVRVVVARFARPATKPEQRGADDAILREERRRGAIRFVVLICCFLECTAADDARGAIGDDHLVVTRRNGRRERLEPAARSLLQAREERGNLVGRRGDTLELGGDVADDASSTSRGRGWDASGGLQQLGGVVGITERVEGSADGLKQPRHRHGRRVQTSARGPPTLFRLRNSHVADSSFFPQGQARCWWRALFSELRRNSYSTTSVYRVRIAIQLYIYLALQQQGEGGVGVYGWRSGICS